MFSLKKSIHIQIILSLILGGLGGVFFKDVAQYVKPVGDIFIHLLRLIVVPILVTSIITGITSIGDVKEFRKLGVSTVMYYVFTTSAAVLIGLTVVNMVKPGQGNAFSFPSVELPDHLAEFSFLSVIYDIFPSNIISAMAMDNTLGIIFFSLFVGSAMLSVLPKVKSVHQFIKQTHVVIIKMTEWIILVSPFGIFALVYVLISQLGISVLVPLSFYTLTVLSALLIHVLLVLFPLYILFTKKSPIVFVKQLFPALITAFSTGSSLATLPVTMECLEKKAKISKKVTGFVAPVGATINMDGTALYEAVAALFIAQIFGIELSMGEQILVFITATLASIGAAGIPSAGLITILIVLKTVNLPIEGIAILLTVDRFLDMFRTTVNVLGDGCGSAIISSRIDEF